MTNLSLLKYVCLSILMMTPTAVAAQITQPTNTPISGRAWLVTCRNQPDPKQLQCAMTQKVIQHETGHQIVAADVFGDGDNLIMVLSLPHGLDLMAGVDVVVDQGQIFHHDIQTADAAGSYTRFSLTPKMIATFKAGQEISIIVTSTDDQKIKFPITLVGFSDAFSLIKAR